MPRPLLFPVLTCLAIALASPLAAQEEEASPIQKLGFMVGEWEADYTAPNDIPEIDLKAGTKVHEEQNIRWLFNGTVLEMNFQSYRDGEALPPARELAFWDPAQEKLVHTLFGDGYYGTGTWREEDDAMVLEWKITTDEDRVYSGTSYCRPISDSAYGWEIKNPKVNGEDVRPTGKIEFQRKPAPGQKQMKALAFLIGEWEYEDVDGSTAHVQARWINNESFIELRDGDYLEIIGWHPVENRYLAWSFGTNGGMASMEVAPQGDAWELKAVPNFVDKKGIPRLFESTVKSIDGNTLEREWRFGGNVWTTRMVRVSKDSE